MPDTSPPTGQQILARLFVRVLLALLVVLALAFAVDAGILRYRASANRNAFSTITVRPFYAVPRKDKKVEYEFDDPRDQTCSNSLFPQMGYTPCWYLRRHKDQEIPL